MSTIKLTKNELRSQQQRLVQLERYLPTLQLKKAMLQVEVNEARLEIERQEVAVREAGQAVERFTALLAEPLPFDPEKVAEVAEVERSYENIAGVEIPRLQAVHFAPFTYQLFNTPPWFDAGMEQLRRRAEAGIELEIAVEKRLALANELREVSIRVNLFEKVLIPRAKENIKKIRIFLGDQQLAAVAQAKVAKRKIIERQEKR